MRADLRRRRVLAATVMTVPLVAAGCKGVGGLGTLPKAAPDVAVLHHAIATEQALIAQYHSALARSPGLAGTLGPLLAQHREHLARLTSMLIAPATPRATPRPSASATAGAPAPQAATLAALEKAETDAASSLVRRLALAPPALAQLLASIAASESSHALLLHTHRTTR
ncbi:MAG TPA: ferritin-like domain-containing protein [Streptosporangiaceae bacterium]|nr:ferritin-like domain-containing protein [Streptosporangiaceae bacterium]